MIDLEGLVNYWICSAGDGQGGDCVMLKLQFLKVLYESFSDVRSSRSPMLLSINM